MAVLDDFKQQKREFKKLVETVSGLFDEYDEYSDPGRKIARRLMGECSAETEEAFRLEAGIGST